MFEEHNEEEPIEDEEPSTSEEVEEIAEERVAIGEESGMVLGASESAGCLLANNRIWKCNSWRPRTTMQESIIGTD